MRVFIAHWHANCTTNHLGEETKEYDENLNYIFSQMTQRACN